MLHTAEYTGFAGGFLEPSRSVLVAPIPVREDAQGRESVVIAGVALGGFPNA